jgi:intracellular septation protein A
MNSRPASVTTTIVILAFMCLIVIAEGFILAARSHHLPWLATSVGITVFGLPLFAMVKRKKWARIYVTILFLLFAGALIVGNTNNNPQNMAVALGYALFICALLAWNVWSLWSQRVTTYFSQPSGPSYDG